jgi:hypothetical protein
LAKPNVTAFTPAEVSSVTLTKTKDDAMISFSPSALSTVSKEPTTVPSANKSAASLSTSEGVGMATSTHLNHWTLIGVTICLFCLALNVSFCMAGRLNSSPRSCDASIPRFLAGSTTGTPQYKSIESPLQCRTPVPPSMTYEQHNKPRLAHEPFEYLQQKAKQGILTKRPDNYRVPQCTAVLVVCCKQGILLNQQDTHCVPQCAACQVISRVPQCKAFLHYALRIGVDNCANLLQKGKLRSSTSTPRHTSHPCRWTPTGRKH